MVTVLVVDDEPAFLHILAIILQRAGYNVLKANNASEALRLIEHQPPNLVVLDDMMPGMSGSELCILLKQDAHYSHIPILMHTANSRFNNSSVRETVGADGVLIKPSVPADIVSAIDGLVQAHT